MYHSIVKRIAKKNFERVNHRDFDSLLKHCVPNVHHRFGGNHALGGERHDREGLSRWLDRPSRLGPGLHLTVQDVWGTKPSARKAPTSMESLKYTRADIDQSRRFLDVLAERNRLLVVLFQFPVSFKFTTKDKEGEAIRLEGNWDHVADVLNAFKDYPKAIEVCFGGWFFWEFARRRI